MAREECQLELRSVGVDLLLLLGKGKVTRLRVGTCTAAGYIYSHMLRQEGLFLCCGYHNTALEILACLFNVIAETLFMEIFLAVLRSSELPREKQVIITYLNPNPPQIWKNAG